MNKSIIRYLTAGWIGTMGWANLGQAVLADEPEPNLQITVYVYNWAQVEPNTLREAKEVATHIFRKAGVEAALLDHPLPSENEPMDGIELQFLQSLPFFVHIFPHAMAKPSRLRTTVLGLAPGMPDNQDRNRVYVFDHVAARMAQEQVIARLNRTVFRRANKGQILGHGIAHEIGHILLHQASHAPAGLMRANWDRNDLQDMGMGYLLFTPEEAERLRAEVVRRNGVQAANASL